MENLQPVIRPTIGILTNIGSAHDEYFANRQQKIEEKLNLFTGVDTLIYTADHSELHSAIAKKKIRSFCWGTSAEADLQIRKEAGGYAINWKQQWQSLVFPFTDAASIENAMHCVALMLLLGHKPAQIQSRLDLLAAVPMRLAVKEAINGCLVIDDTYNNDLAGLQISLDFLAHQQHRRKRTVILSDILQSGMDEENLVKTIAAKIQSNGAQRFIGIGNVLTRNKKWFTVPATFFNTTEDFLRQFESSAFSDEVILVKGSRMFRLERITSVLQRKLHGTVLEIDLGSMVHNLNFFKSRLHPEAKLMVMVKALAYGSGSVQVANLLQYHRVQYLGVAYADEGAELRRNNINTPVMVMNPSAESFESLLTHSLEPAIYSITLLNELVRFLQGRRMAIHIKLDTGMHRLGFDENQFSELLKVLTEHRNLTITSVFSHLSGADDEQFDGFSAEQADRFVRMANEMETTLHIKALRHLVNTAGILRFPQYHFDMVRLGIGLYGVAPVPDATALKQAVTLKTTISQIRTIKAGESVGYSRSGIAGSERTIATIAIGYADGFSRAFSNGKGVVLVNGKLAPVVGNVCMDMTMVDVTGLDAREGDTVVIFSEDLPVTELAARINTIPYEILTNTSDRVRRVFVAEGM
ncbi:bifunctional UDP-N-acetylmuramoyl-tripeptide:D-alanyl-D-alanine ligase/alanine racemase [Oscillatoria amoena NRMC-F 0135]|nr:bifunctional UDP-N-acetylmuramoyl-tripeptide:D-alanyl-D-alanine ligase/alanine racemase [Oscillatoria amoena NRMC-F 0135]